MVTGKAVPVREYYRSIDMRGLRKIIKNISLGSGVMDGSRTWYVPNTGQTFYALVASLVTRMCVHCNEPRNS